MRVCAKIVVVLGHPAASVTKSPTMATNDKLNFMRKAIPGLLCTIIQGKNYIFTCLVLVLASKFNNVCVIFIVSHLRSPEYTHLCFSYCVYEICPQDHKSMFVGRNAFTCAYVCSFPLTYY
ncbi:hypothetical protein CARUB_v10010674mg [Capsella rubella]|uniref:Uncharacterized protein n=1 Tax=Capsella rubella TaxID=81985 RepID=R0IJR4_9BRAS|nr:hypothetical protein CARUB_v10010674mg [Capsella rubella]